MIDPFSNALKQLSLAASSLPKNQAQHLLTLLSQPEREVKVFLPIKMDNGQTSVFEGFRVQYNSARGPYKGGIRYHPQVSDSEVRALSFWMTIKNAVADLPLGGGKGGIIVDPKKLSAGELERLTRAFGRAIAPIIGPFTDIPAPDVNTDGEIMRYLDEEFAKSVKLKKGKLKYSRGEILATFTGKPLDYGGSLGRTEATGLGGFYVLQSALKSLTTNRYTLTANPSVAVQGFGNVGQYFAKFASENGFKIVAVSDSQGGIYSPDGLDIPKLMTLKSKENKSVTTLAGNNIQRISNSELLELPIDILVPSALEAQLTDKNAAKVKAKIILEMANGPTIPEADEIFNKKEIIVVPDVLANSGGVSVSYCEWIQNIKNLHWTFAEVDKWLKAKMTKATKEVFATSKKYRCSLRQAAFLLALERIFQVI